MKWHLVAELSLNNTSLKGILLIKFDFDINLYFTTLYVCQSMNVWVTGKKLNCLFELS